MTAEPDLPADEGEPLDPFMEKVAMAMMEHASSPEGAVEWPAVAACFATLMAEIIGQQPDWVAKTMRIEFDAQFDTAIRLAALRASVEGKGLAS